MGDKAQSLLCIFWGFETLIRIAGDHTRTISVAVPTTGGLMKFAVKRATCLGCKVPLKAGCTFIVVGISHITKPMRPSVNTVATNFLNFTANKWNLFVI